MCVSEHVECVWKPEDNFIELSFFLLLHGSKDRTQVVRLTQQALLPAEPCHQAWG